MSVKSEIINEDGRIRIANHLARYSLSFSAYRTLQNDHIRFMQRYEKDFSSTYIATILCNYMDYAREKNCNEFEDRICMAFQSRSHIFPYYKEKRISLNKTVIDRIERFEFISHPEFKKRAVIEYILEEYATLPFATREKLFCYTNYTKIMACIDQQEIMLIHCIDKGKEHEEQLMFKPYLLAIDDNSFSYYLIGFAKIRNADSAYTCRSLKLSRITKCDTTCKEFLLSGKEKRETDIKFKRFGAAYISEEEIQKTVVRLSEKGYQELFLKRIARQRPIPVSTPKVVEHNGKQYYELVFDCSHAQIRNYFFSFGAEAEIISPVSLRNQFKEEITAALNLYSQDTEKLTK